jgi:hypothetical protein
MLAAYIEAGTFDNHPSGTVHVEDLRREPDAQFAPGERVPNVAERSFVVGRQTWTVREAVDPVTLARVLVFTSDGVGRRVRIYPSDWQQLTAEDLYALSWSR